MEYFLDVHFFSPEEIALNATVLQWPQKINPIFDEHDDVRIFFLWYILNLVTFFTSFGLFILSAYTCI